MTLPNGALSMYEVNLELGRPGTQSINMNDMAVRTLAGVGGYNTGISMLSLRGKSSYTAVYATGRGDSYSEGYYGSRQQSVHTLNPSVSPSSGTGSYSYTWEFESAPGSFSLENVNSQVPNLKITVPRFGISASCVLRCTVSDGRTSYVVTGIVNYIEVYDANT